MTDTPKTDATEQAIDAALAKLKDFVSTEFEQRDALAAERARKEANAALEAKFEAMKAANPDFALPGVETDPEKKEHFSIARYIKSLAKNNPNLAPYEHEAMAKVKDLTLGTPSEGGNIVPPEYIPSLIPYLYKNVVAFSLGAQMMTDVAPGSPITIPKQTSSATGYWIGTEGTTITESQLAVGQIEMTPHTLAAYCVISNTLLENSAPVADRVVTNDLERRLRVSMDAGILSGTGGSGQPTGMTQVAGINTLDLSSTTGNITYDQLLEIIYKLDEDDALMGSLGFALSPKVLHDIRSMKDATQEIADGGSDEHIVNTQPLERRVLTAGAPKEILGYRFETTNSLPATGNSLIFADWSTVLVPVWKGLEILASNTAKDAFEKDQTHVRALLRCDVGVQHTEAICVGQGYGN